MRIGRRRFIKQSALGMGSVLAGASLAQARESIPLRYDPYEQVTLAKTGIKMSRVCMGTGVKGGVREGKRSSAQVRMGQADFTALIQGAYERGVRVFDLADMYGTHPYLIPALKSI